MKMVIDAGKTTFGNDVPMVIGPAPQERVELADQTFCLVPVPFLDVSASLFQHAADTLPCWFDQQLLSVFAHILAEEIKSLGDVGDDGLFFGELESALLQELNDGGWTFCSRISLLAAVTAESSA